MNRLTVATVCFVTIFSFSIQAICKSDKEDEADQLSFLKERAFCLPNTTFPQPQSWQDQPIQYAPANRGANLVLTLDQQLYHILLPVINQYALENQLDIRVRDGTCGVSAGQISRKLVDIAGFCCPPAATDRLPGLTFHTLGIASIAMMVHPANPIESLTLKQLRTLYRGHTRHWSQITTPLGQPGPHWPIHTIGRLHCKQRPGHWRTLLWEPDDFSPRMEEVGAIPDVIQRVMAQRGAIAYETLWHIQRARALGHPKTIAINGHPPEDQAALIAGKYPLYRVFNLTLWEGKGLTNPKAGALVDYLTKQVEKMNTGLHFIPAKALRQSGWEFHDNELVGEPK